MPGKSDQHATSIRLEWWGAPNTPCPKKARGGTRKSKSDRTSQKERLGGEGKGKACRPILAPIPLLCLELADLVGRLRISPPLSECPCEGGRRPSFGE
ncbi:uncharacterized protein SPSK_05729 [Sporothrix schenckii 1099-18]|uniref:Uncharacterized protein n=1 Tax=Sporothrix schenckii 1099-18 TaxID=1397361 RepID=A0A0F2LSG1_SPOSC|nr:uncharacterized protein SPSK_05729 [Sporothrix schenckii 1099-18]KJR80427.1 hypothetical protein SPSK_05729 [Sporothrix schenckii 1099-18]